MRTKRQKLEAQEKEKRTLVANLQKKQKGLQSEVNKKRREANQLNARIDRLIAEEIERAANVLRKRLAEKRQPVRRRMLRTKLPPEPEQLPDRSRNHWMLLR